MKKTPIDRLMAKVNFNGPVSKSRPWLGPCWEHTGAPNQDGGKRNKSRWGHPRPPEEQHIRFLVNGKKTYVHRFMFEYSRGRKLESWELVNHLCHNTHCVHPLHLEATDISGNNSDTRVRAIAALGVAA